MPQLDKMTLEGIIDKFKNGNIEGGANDIAHFAPKYPNDQALQEAKRLLEEGKTEDAIAGLEHAANIRSDGYNAPSGLPFEDRRSETDSKTAGR